MTIIVTGGDGFIVSKFLFKIMKADKDYTIICI